MACTKPRAAPAHKPDGPYKLSVHPGTGSLYVDRTEMSYWMRSNQILMISEIGCHLPIGGRNIPAGNPWARWFTRFSEHLFVIVYVFGISPTRQCWIRSRLASSNIRVIWKGMLILVAFVTGSVDCVWKSAVPLSIGGKQARFHHHNRHIHTHAISIMNHSYREANRRIIFFKTFQYLNYFFISDIRFVNFLRNEFSIAIWIQCWYVEECLKSVTFMKYWWGETQFALCLSLSLSFCVHR